MPINKITFTGHNIEITDTLRDVIKRKFERIKRHFSNDILNTHVILTAQGVNNSIEATIQVAGAVINAKGTNEKMYKAIDEMFYKLDRQIGDLKTIREDHRKGTITGERVQEQIIEVENESDFD